MEFYYNSRDLECKTPFGAMECGENVAFFVSCPEADGVILRAWSRNGETLFPMDKKDGKFFVRIPMPKEPQLFWYYFIVDTKGGRKYYFNNEENTGGIGILKDKPIFSVKTICILS